MKLHRHLVLSTLLVLAFATLAAALEAYAKLREASQIEIELGRAGATVRHSYRIL